MILRKIPHRKEINFEKENSTLFAHAFRNFSFFPVPFDYVCPLRPKGNHPLHCLHM